MTYFWLLRNPTPERALSPLSAEEASLQRVFINLFTQT
jgi:hypothetical protein